ncbi:alpha/beta hydrolase fold domain-containing protein [Aquirufa sp. ROCK2-A2]
MKTDIKSNRNLLLGILFVIHHLAIGQTANQDSSKYQILSNLIYGSATDHRNELDIYLPKNHSKKTPMVVFIHGGFWAKGSKQQLPKPLIDLLVGEKGYAMASINYRFVKAGANKYPTQMDDVVLAMNYLSSKADSLGYKKRSFAMIGASAGAHLALMYAYANDPQKMTKTVIDIVGPTDLADSVVRGRQGIADATISYFLGNPDPKADIAKTSSPIFQLTKKTGVPTIIFHGEKDELVDVHQAKNLHQRLLQLGFKTEMYLYSNETHEMKKSLPDVFIKTAAWLEKIYPIL